jgi:hypothetical protein
VNNIQELPLCLFVISVFEVGIWDVFTTLGENANQQMVLSLVH